MRAGVLALTLVAGLAPGCGGEPDDALTVLAASSLTEVFGALEGDFEDTHGVDVQFSFGSSTTLAQQAADGAPGDVLATADEGSMELAREAGVLAGAPRVFAANSLVLVAGRDSRVRAWDDLAGARWVRCADDVPCGHLARELLEETPPAGDPASLEVDVKSVLAKVVSGEAEAGFVYASDAVAAGDAVRPVAVPGPTAATVLLAAPLEGEREALAADWVALLSSPDGRAALRKAGFEVRPRG